MFRFASKTTITATGRIIVTSTKIMVLTVLFHLVVLVGKSLSRKVIQPCPRGLPWPARIAVTVVYSILVGCRSGESRPIFQIQIYVSVSRLRESQKNFIMFASLLLHTQRAMIHCYRSVKASVKLLVLLSITGEGVHYIQSPPHPPKLRPQIST